MIRVLTFGGFGLEIDGVSRGAELARRLAAVAAILAAHGNRGISRDRLLHLLWSESDPTRARHALTQTLYSLRRLLGGDQAIIGTAQLAFNADLVSSDVGDFENAEERRDPAAALTAYRGSFLDGFSVNGAPEFERWVEERRHSYARQLADLLEQAASRREGEGALDEAAGLLRRRAALDPLDANGALDLMRGLARSGDVRGALQHARIYGELVRQQLELEPDLRVVELEQELEQTLQERGAEPTASDAVPRVASSASAPARRAVESMARARGQLEDWVRHGRSWWRSRSLAWRANVLRSVTALAILFLGLFTVTRLLQSFQDPPPRNSIAVLPFRTSAVSADLAFLSRGAAELLAGALAERDTAAIIPADRLDRWWRDTFGDNTAVATDSALMRIQTLGVGRVVTGSVVGNEARVVVRATAIDVTTRAATATAVADAPLDSLSSLIDRVATLLVADAAGAGEALARAPRVSASALRSYLAGRDAYARGEASAALQHFTAALTHDSSLAPAALGLALASDWLDDARTRTAALDVVRGNVRQLSNSAQQTLRALLGPRYPAPLLGSEFAAGWERVVASEPPSADPWVELGRRLMADGALAGAQQPYQRARAAFQRALVVDSTSVAARQGLTALAIAERNPQQLRATSLGADTSDASLALAWRLAAFTGDAPALAALRDRMTRASDDALRRIALAALYDGASIEDGAHALEVRQGQGALARVDAILARHAFAMTGGRPTDALQATRDLQREPSADGAQWRLQVLDRLYADGDSAVAADAAQRLAQRTAGTLGASSDERSVRLADLCVLEQWRVWHGDYGATDATVRLLSRAEETRYTAPIVSAGLACGVLVEAIAAGVRGLPRADDALDRAERLAMVGPTAGDLRHYATLALARVHLARGEADRALELVRRRSTARGWPRYLASYLAMEARLASQRQDTLATQAAVRHYLALRPRPEATMSSSIDSLRVLLSP